MVGTCWASNNLREHLPGPWDSKEQHVPGCLEDVGSRSDTHPRYPSAPVPMSVKDELQGELCPDLTQPWAVASLGHRKLGIIRSSKNT